jgi:hypothetical protein
MEDRFEDFYRQWRAHCARPEVMEHSSDAAYIENSPFQAIVDLGEAAIPFLVAKLKRAPEAHFLVHALERVAPKTFSAEEIDNAKRKYGSPLGNQGFARMWIEWWETSLGAAAKSNHPEREDSAPAPAN